jgi:ABC-type lipoprotein export system ATPase subunit
MLTLRGIHKTYSTKKGVKNHVLKGIDVDFGQRGFVFILGKSGSGKSTLLNILGGLDRFGKGDIIIKGTSSSSFTANHWDAYRNTYVGFVFQDFNILDNYSVEKNISLALEVQGVKKQK